MATISVISLHGELVNVLLGRRIESSASKNKKRRKIYTNVKTNPSSFRFLVVLYFSIITTSDRQAGRQQISIVKRTIALTLLLLIWRHLSSSPCGVECECESRSVWRSFLFQFKRFLAAGLSLNEHFEQILRFNTKHITIIIITK